MNIQTLKVSKLKNWESNPREIDDNAFSALKKYITKWGLLDPLKVDSRDKATVLGGNMRLKALRDLGVEEVECNIVEVADDDEALEVALIDNNQFGVYIKSQLVDLVQNTKLELGDFHVDLKPVSLDSLMPHEVKEDDYEEPEEIETDIQEGDIFILGNHRLMCGDSTKIEDVEKLMDGQKADMVFTDPPYGVDYASKNEFLNNQDKGNHIQKDITNDTMTLEETEQFIYDCFVNLRLSLADKSSYYITAPQGGDLLMMMMMMTKAGLPLRHMLIWVKNNHVLGRTDYNYKHEPILFGWVDTHNFYKNGKHKFSTWLIDKPHSSKLHPTMKPIELIANAIENSSKSGDAILDLFGGSGSTLIACEQTDRKCYMMELSPEYCEIICQRWEKLTGKLREKING